VTGCEATGLTNNPWFARRRPLQGLSDHACALGRDDTGKLRRRCRSQEPIDSSAARWFNPFFSGQGDVMAAGGKSLTRVELYDAVYRKVGLSRVESTSFVELVLKEITDCIARGETVKLSSFGTFTVRKKGQRMGRNPKTGIDAPIQPRRVVVFKASAILKQQISGSRRLDSQPSNGEAHIE
jgi:integration host factor subunit alpha